MGERRYYGGAASAPVRVAAYTMLCYRRSGPRALVTVRWRRPDFVSIPLRLLRCGRIRGGWDDRNELFCCVSEGRGRRFRMIREDCSRVGFGQATARARTLRTWSARHCRDGAFGPSGDLRSGEDGLFLLLRGHRGCFNTAAVALGRQASHETTCPGGDSTARTPFTPSLWFAPCCTVACCPQGYICNEHARGH
jgi:hypothetical protein